MIKTQRLILRSWQQKDLRAFAALNADPLVMQFFPSPLTKEESDALAARIQKHIETHGYGFWAAEADAFIGMIGIAHVNFVAPFTPAVEIGWRLAHPYWGKGYATEGAKASLEYAFKMLKLPEIVSFTSAQNFRSRAVMERLGMRHDSKDDFDHPKLPEDSHLRRHVLYRIKNQ